MELDSPIVTYHNLKYSLFLKQRFLPIFLATFLGAFNDNLLRSGLVVMIAYSGSRGVSLPTTPEILVTICSALLVIPLIVFSSISGSLADKYEKSFLVRCTKLAEVAIMACAYYGFAHHNILLLMGLLFVSGTHTSLYSPIKFSILPEHLCNKELLAGNGFMAGGSYLAVLLGLIAGGLLEEYPGNIIGTVALIVAFAGLLASLFIPPSPIAHPDTRVSLNIWKGTKAIIGYACRDRILLHSILGLSWFLLVGSVFMSQFANYAHTILHADNEVYILFLTVFSIGIAIGSLITDTLLKGEISLRLSPFAIFGVSLFTYGMVAATRPPAHEGLQDVAAFLSESWHWVILSSMLMVAVCGGIYMVPLYATLQSHTPPEYRSRIMAASNLSDAVFATAIALLSVMLLRLGFKITDLFLFVATLNLFIVYYAKKIT